MLSLCLALALASAPGTHHQKKVAVLDVEDTSGAQAARAKMLTQVIGGELPKLGGFQVISANEIRSMLGFEKQRQLLGCKEDSCLAELGGALGVDYLVSSQLAKFGSRFRLDLHLLDASRSRVVASEGNFIAGNDDALADGAVAMLRKLFADAGLSSEPSPTASSGMPDAAAGGLTETAPEGPSRTGAWITGGAAVVLAGAALAMTLHTRSTFNTAVDNVRQGKPADDSSLSWSGPLADGLWAGAAVCAGVSTYLFLRGPSSPGAGGELGVGGSF